MSEKISIELSPSEARTVSAALQRFSKGALGAEGILKIRDRVEAAISEARTAPAYPTASDGDCQAKSNALLMLRRIGHRGGPR